MEEKAFWRDLTDEQVMTSKVQLDIEVGLGEVGATLVQSGRLGGEQPAGHSAERGPAPQGDRLPEQCRGLGRPSLTGDDVGLLREPLGPVHVDEFGIDTEYVPRRLGDQFGTGLGEALTQTGNTDLYLGACGLRRILVPDGVDEIVGGDHATRFQKQGAQNHLLTTRGNPHRACGGIDLKVAKNTEDQENLLPCRPIQP